MRNRLIAIIASAASGFSASGSSVVYDIHPASGAEVALTVEKTGFMSGKKHLLVFERYRGTLAYDPESPELSRVDLAIESASVVVKDTWVSEKERKNIREHTVQEMLAAERFPNVRFTSTAVSRKGEASFEVQGMLTIRETAKPAVASVKVDSRSGRLASVAGQSVVRMKDYGLKPPTAALGTIGTKNEMTLNFVLLPTVKPADTRVQEPSDNN